MITIRERRYLIISQDIEKLIKKYKDKLGYYRLVMTKEITMGYNITIYDFVEDKVLTFRILPEAYEKMIKPSTPDKLKKMKKLSEGFIETFAKDYRQNRKGKQQKKGPINIYLKKIECLFDTEMRPNYNITLFDEQREESIFLKVSNKTFNTLQNIIETDALDTEYKDAITEMHKKTVTINYDLSEFQKLITLSLYHGWDSLNRLGKW